MSHSELECMTFSLMALLPPSECQWLVNTSPLNYRRWVGQNSGPIFSHLWNKVRQIKFACTGVSIICNTIFRLTVSCCVQEIIVIKSWTCPKSRQNFVFLGCQIFGGRAPKYLTEFHKSGSPQNMWRSLMTIGQRTSKISRRKKERNKRRVKYNGGLNAVLMRRQSCVEAYAEDAQALASSFWSEKEGSLSKA